MQLTFSFVKVMTANKNNLIIQLASYIMYYSYIIYL